MKQNENLDKLKKEVGSCYQVPAMSTEQIARLRNRMKQAKKENHWENIWNSSRKVLATAAGIALLLCVLSNTSEAVAMVMQRLPVLGDFIRLVTVRKYQYEDEQYYADIDVGELVFSELLEAESLEEPVRRELEITIDNINAKIRKVTEELELQFKEIVETREGYMETVVKSEQLETTENYFAMKLQCFMAAGSGYEWNYYFMIDLATGKQLMLKDLFPEGSEFVTAISEDIRLQMQTQMAEDANKMYWLDSSFASWNFLSIREDAGFYVNADGNVVICFNEGEVAPMYMGALEFVIAPEVIENICSKGSEMQKILH